MIPTKPKQTHLPKYAKPTDEHEFFFDFLLLSPSYYLAHRNRTGALSKTEKAMLPSDFKKVLIAYDRFGDVYSTVFEKWWEDIGAKQFAGLGQWPQARFIKTNEQATKDFELISIPKQLPAEIALEQIANLLSTWKPTEIRQNANLIKNKVPERTLLDLLSLVNDKARLENKNGKRISNWELALAVNLKSMHAKGLTATTKKSTHNTDARIYLGMLVSKKLADALCVAENAARGEFPSLAKIRTGLNFDFDRIWTTCTNNLKMKSSLRLAKRREGVTIPKTYFERKIKPKLNKKREFDTAVKIAARKLLRDEK